ncbi:MAG: DNA polymerase III subunit beta [Deltaproteobacteria bacterium]|uniref:Beta sliding clamp n=1 Tax=Candidatus Zymogenus saltonus TaxID=2844893 RepID=A0A9D8KHB3_9DELT|nr:DNA polymerase III subunit beta [Candidatus Zymogenus saltonus]
MEFKIKQEELLKGLSRTQSIVEKKNTIKILSNVLLKLIGGKLVIEATDLEVGISGSYEAEVITEGGITVDAKTLFEVVRQIPDGTSIHCKKKENNWMELIAVRSVFNLVGLSVEDYPKVPSFEGEEQWKMNPDVLKGMIDKTIFSVSHEDMRYNLSGVYMETLEEGGGVKLRMVATDGHRLSLVDTPLEGKFPLPPGKGIIAPRKGLMELRKILDEGKEQVGMKLEDSNLMVKRDDLNLVMRLVDGTFPDYKQVIPKNNDKKIVFNADDLARTLRRVSVVSADRIKMVKFHITADSIEVTSESPNMGNAKEEMKVEYSGGDMDIGFNASYMLDILNAVDEDSVELMLLDESSPGEVRPKEGKNYYFIIMPMKI